MSHTLHSTEDFNTILFSQVYFTSLLAKKEVRKSINSKEYGFLDKDKIKSDFLEYYANLCDKKPKNGKWSLNTFTTSLMANVRSAK